MKAPTAAIAASLLMSGTALAQSLDIPDEVPKQSSKTIEPWVERHELGDAKSQTAEGELVIEPNFGLAPEQNEHLGESNPLYYDDPAPAPGLVIKVPTN
jgi:hypothetical protein